VPVPLASWNPARDVWETSHSHIDLFSGLSAVWSETWPTWGMWADGVAYALPTSVPLTGGFGSSSSPGLLPTPESSDATGGRVSSEVGGTRPSGAKRAITLATRVDALLRTPTAQLAVNGGSQHPDKRKAGGHGPTLADEVEHLLPTPTATPYGNNQSPSPGAAVRPSLDSLAPMLLPTPKATNNENRQSPDRYGPNLGMVLRELTGDLTDPPSADGNEPSDE
jgi:hypothetical protein